jgi:DNA-binding CsgD family transcriptional regulator
VDDRRDFSAEQVLRLSALAPHVSQAFELGSRLQAAAQFEARLQSHFDRLRCGLIICNGNAQVQWMNRSAEALLASNSVLRLLGGGLHTRASTGSDSLLREIVESAAGKHSTGRYVALGHGPHKLHVAIQPMASTNSPHGGASVLLVVTGTADCGGIPPVALAKLFGLTPAEASLVGALVTGRTLEQYAHHRGVSVGTARGQLKQVLAKTGAARQSELVRLVLSSAAAQLLPPTGSAQA